MALLGPNGTVLALKLDKTPSDQLSALQKILDICKDQGIVPVCCIEQIHYLSDAMSKYSTLKLGINYGILIGLLTNRVAYREVPPSQWQRQQKCLTKGDKQRTYKLAQQLFPGIKVTHAIADALLIARYARETWR